MVMRCSPRSLSEPNNPTASRWSASGSEDLGAVPLLERGRELRSHAAVGPDGANVNFVGNGSGGWAMRTFERGVEAETLACGTGAAASAAVLAQAEGVALPIDIRTPSGVLLTVSAEVDAASGFGRPRLAGEGRILFRAILGA